MTEIIDQTENKTKETFEQWQERVSKRIIDTI
jgi:hypothetical protein